MKKLKLALVGRDVSKSQSPAVHKFIASHMGNSVSYDNISVSEGQFDEQIKEILKNYDGFNVTIPYKLKIIPYLEKIGGDARLFGSVNTVTTRDMRGDNTDGKGFMMSLQDRGIDVKCQNVLVLGAGGAGRSVSKKLLDAGAEVSVFDKFYANVCSLARDFGGIRPLERLEIKPYHLIVNATGVGMHETEGQSPVGADLISLCDAAAELIYTPATSEFLKIASSLGKLTLNGEGMLFYQAYFSECVYFGVEPRIYEAENLFKEYLREKRK